MYVYVSKNSYFCTTFEKRKRFKLCPETEIRQNSIIEGQRRYDAHSVFACGMQP